MVDTSLVILALILVFDFVVSLWNAYASGVTWGLLRHQPGQRFSKTYAIAGLGLAFAGMAYATTIVLGWVALLVGFLAPWDFVYLGSFDFLVFGAMIIGFGLLITVQSVTIAWRQRNFGAIAVAAWNTFAEVWDIATYLQGFQTAASVLKGGRQDRGNVLAVLLVAVSIALLVTYFAFRAGLRKAQGAIDQSPQQSAGDANAVAPPESQHHRAIRRAATAGAVIVAVVVAAILLFHFLPPSPQVQVREIDVWAPSNVCGLNAQPISYAGFSDSPGSVDAFQLQVENFNATSCTVTQAATNTTGFTVASTGVPLTVGANQSAYLNVTVQLPSFAFDGALDVIFT